MSSPQSLLRLFYQYSCETILYLKDGKLKGYIQKQEVTESLSDISRTNVDLTSLVHRIEDMDQILSFLERSSIVKDNKKRIPIINKRFKFVDLWERVDLIRSWEDIPKIEKWDLKTKVRQDTEPAPTQDESTYENGVLSQKLALLAMETLPIGMLAVSALGEEILCNEGLASFKENVSQRTHDQKYPF